MRILRVSLLLAAAPVVAGAMTVYYSDPFGAAATSCASPSCDVIGASAYYDLGGFSLSFDPVTRLVTVTVATNFGPNGTLSPFLDYGIRLDAADIIFTRDNHPAYGVAITSHTGVIAGTFYSLSTTAALLTAYDVLQLGDGWVYRPTTPVWIRNDGAGSVTALSNGAVSSAITGNGTTTPYMTISASFVASQLFMDELLAGRIGFQVSSATCGNDVLSGTLNFGQTPEPATWGLILLGLLSLWTRHYRLQAAAPTIRRVLRS